jgi:hypothetical protein
LLCLGRMIGYVGYTTRGTTTQMGYARVPACGTHGLPHTGASHYTKGVAMATTNWGGVATQMATLLNQDGQRSYTIKADRAAAYGALLAQNGGLGITPEMALAYLRGRVPGTVNAQIRALDGYGAIKRAWDWPRGVLACLAVLGTPTTHRGYSAARG